MQQSNMRMLLEKKSSLPESRPISANLLLLENVRNRPNSTASYTFGLKNSSKTQISLKVNDTIRIDKRNRPQSATPSMIGGGRR